MTSFISLVSCAVEGILQLLKTIDAKIEEEAYAITTEKYTERGDNTTN